jgi:ATP-dependent RNA helicase DDX1
MAAFEEVGVLPELIAAVAEQGWELPTDCQAEAVPLILTGGDVLCAAETGSGKTGAFALPVLQEVHEAISETLHSSGSQPSERIGRNVRMSPADRHADFAVDSSGTLCQSRVETSWCGGHATVGVKSSKWHFEVNVNDDGLVRVGFSSKIGSLELGTDKHTFGYGGTGKKSHAKQFESYGEPFGKGDVIGCSIDLESSEKTVSFSKNGQQLGVSHVVPEMLHGKALYPALCLKNAEVQLSFSGPFKQSGPPDESYRPLTEVTGNDGVVEGSDTTILCSSKRQPRAVILEPARDLAEQTHSCIESFKVNLTNPEIRATLLVGGTNSSEQERSLSHGTDIVTGTPGRVIDMLESGKLDVSGVQFFVLDEADRLLDTGNFESIMKVFNRLPKTGLGQKRLQVLMFSATLHSNDVRSLIHRICAQPTRVDLKGKDAVPETVHHVQVKVDPRKEGNGWGPLSPRAPTDNVHSLDGIKPGQTDTEQAMSLAIKSTKPHMLKRIIDKHKMDQCIIFCRTNFDCDNLEAFLNYCGGGDGAVENLYSCAVLGAARRQQERRENLQAFKDGMVRLLICTDVAARGIDVQGLPFMINYNIPEKPEDYIHRTGRVGRSEHFGLAISLVGTSKEKVWFCQKPGHKPWFNPSAKDVKLNEEGGHTTWLNEPEYMSKIEQRLQQKVPELKKDLSLPDKLGTDASQYGQQRAGNYSASISEHLAQLEPNVRAVADLEGKAQASFWRLKTAGADRNLFYNDEEMREKPMEHR